MANNLVSFGDLGSRGPELLLEPGLALLEGDDALFLARQTQLECQCPRTRDTKLAPDITHKHTAVLTCVRAHVKLVSHDLLSFGLTRRLEERTGSRKNVFLVSHRLHERP